MSWKSGGQKTTARKDGNPPQPVKGLSYHIKEKVREIKPLDLVDILQNNSAAGWDIALVGESKSGKTVSAISLGFMNLEFKDLLLNAGYTHIVKALEDGLIPEVKKIVIVDSECALQTQMAYPYEKSMFAPLRDRISIIPVEVRNLMKIADSNGDVSYDEESVNDIVSSVSDFIAAIEYVSSLDNNTLVVIDSMSVYKLLLDAYTGFMTNVRISKMTDVKEINEARKERWSERNSMWLDSLNKMRKFPGWNVSTYMMKTNSQWVIEAFKVDRLVPVWTETTEYRYDMVIRLDIERNTNVRIARPISARYMNTDNPQDDVVEIYGKIEQDIDRVQFLRVIENALRIMMSGDE